MVPLPPRLAAPIVLFLSSLVPGVHSTDCPGDVLVSVRREVYRCVRLLENDRQLQSSLRFFQSKITLEYWRGFCESTPRGLSCLENTLKSCGEGYIRKAILVAESKLNVNSLRDSETICEGARVAAWLRKLFAEGEPDRCMKDGEFDMDVVRCVALLQDEMGEYVDEWTRGEGISEADRANLRPWVIRAHLCALHALPRSCNEATRALLTFIVNSSVPYELKVSESAIPTRPLQELVEEDPAGREQFNVGVFGDPHLVVYSRDTLQTCSARGRQQYLSNRYVQIRGANSHVRAGSRATALTEVRVEFFDKHGAELGMYEASSGKLPSEFQGNKIHVRAGEEKLVLHTLDAGERIAISHQSVGIVIVVRRWEKYYTFTVRMSDAILNASFGLLTSGCPRDEMITLPNFQSPPTVQTACMKACATVKTVGKYDFKSSCRYDCIEAGNTAIGEMTLGFIRDLEDIVSFYNRFFIQVSFSTNRGTMSHLTPFAAAAPLILVASSFL